MGVFGNWEKKKFGARICFWSGGPSKKHFICLEAFCEEDRFFWEKLIFTELISVSDRQFFGPLETKFGPALKSAHYASRCFLSKNNFFHKTHFVIFFRNLTRIFPMKFWRKFRRCRQNSKLRVRKLFVELHNFRGNFFFFLLSAFGQKKYFRKKICTIESFYSACPKKLFR